MIHKPFFILFYFLLFFCAGCASSLKNQRQYILENDTIIRAQSYDRPVSRVQIQYLGCGGLLIKKNDIKILVDPFFSNPGPFVSLLWKKLEPDTVAIDKAMAHLDLSGVNNVLVTHGHYDHIMDVPYIYNNYLNNDPEILCNQTSSWILFDQKVRADRIKDVYEHALGDNKPGKWMYFADSTYRILPIISKHAPHLRVLGLEFYLLSGKYENVPQKEKRTSYYRQGEMNLSFLIDFMDEDKKTIIHRVQVLTGGASSRSASLISMLPEARKVDVLALTVGLHNNEPDYPERVLRELEPDFVIGAHWEDFFQPYFHKKKKGVRMTNHRSFAKKMNEYVKGRWIKPLPLTSITFEN